MSKFKRLVNDGKSTSFWLDSWCTDASLRTRFPRLYSLDSNRNDSVHDKRINGWSFVWNRNINGGITGTQFLALLELLPDIVLIDHSDCWIWDNGSTNIFTVKEARSIIDNASLPSLVPSTMWNRFLPKKINILAWRVMHDRIPTRWNLNAKGIDIENILCPICSSSPESSFHLMWACNLAQNVWRRVCLWLEISIPIVSSITDLFHWVSHIQLSAKNKSILEAIFCVTLWAVWKFRNKKIYDSHQIQQYSVFDKIVFYSFIWFSNRNSKTSKSWINWMNNPFLDSIL